MNDIYNNPVFQFLATGLLLTGWLRSHIWSRGLTHRWTWLAFLGRSALGFLTLLTASEVARHAVVFSTNWRLWPLLIMAALLTESVMALARLERNIVSRRAGRALTVLRIATILAVVLMLLQPVFVIELFHQVKRHIVVLLDVSASMQVPDNNLTAAEKLRLSESLHVPAAHRPYHIDKIAEQLGEAGQNLLAQADGLNALSSSTPEILARQLKPQAPSQRKALKQVRDALQKASKTLTDDAAAPFLQKKEASTPAANLKRFTDQLATETAKPLDLAIERIDDWQNITNCSAAFDTVRDTLRKTGTFLAEAEGRLHPIGDAVDESFYQSLSESERKTIDRVASLRRVEIANQLLAGTDKSSLSPSLLSRLDKEYGVLAFTFGAFPAEIKTSTLLESPTAGSITSPPPRQLQSTDIASVLEKVSTTLLPEQTAGIILLSDGRHNAAPGAVESIGRKFGVQRVPVFPIVLGGNRFPPTDAAIASVSAPESVSTNERVSFNVDLKLDGLSGSNVTVTLFDGATPVASNTVTPTDAAFRKQLQLSDSPKTNGLHAYRLQTSTFSNEVDSSNNVFNIPVLVDSDSVNVLLIEGRPRWEFRFLKNLFMQRDKNVRLQYLLFQPDRIEGLTNSTPRPAAVAAERTETEATFLPANEAEWMKFDLIILGDVAPDELGRANMDILRRYVLNRGGTLVVIAGSRHMPQAYTGTPLAEILPVTFRPAIRPLLTAPEQEFRLSLTAEGRNTVFMKLDDDPAENQKAWNDVPGLRWRNGALTARDNATVLAYATSPQADPEGHLPLIPGATDLLKQQQIERENPLIVSHQAGFGSVLMFGFDQTWRLRYKKGDQNHHKLWGQIIRWATSDRIATGTETIRIGTPRSRYPVGSPVRITARLVTTDFKPITNAVPSVTLWAGGQKLSHFRLSYRESSPGLYATELNSLPAGQYRIELDPTGIRELASGGSFTAAAEFSISAAADTEKVELAADRAGLTRLAALTAGKVLDPAALDSIAQYFGPAKTTNTERRQLDLWDSWPWFLLILALLTAEWLLRKKVRLP